MFLRDIVVREARFARNRQLIDQVVAEPRSTGVTTQDVLGVLDGARLRADR